MAVDLIKLSVLANRANNQVFNQVVNNRSIRFSELISNTGLNRDETKQALRELKNASLIEETGVPIEDFKIYYITAAGLETSREARRYG
jgi:predicted transcriptional regulator